MRPQDCLDESLYDDFITFVEKVLLLLFKKLIIDFYVRSIK